MTDRRRNLYRVNFWRSGYMDDELRWYTEHEFIETWSETKAQEIFSAKHPVHRLPMMHVKDAHMDYEIKSVDLVVEDV